MVVDDVSANLAVLEHMLTSQGYEVRTFPSGELALPAAAKDPPDLILLDIMMPGMSGYEVCTRLKSEPELSDIPVLFISSLSEFGDKVSAFAVGAVDYITKPFHQEEVLARIRTQLDVRRMRRELTLQNRYLQDLVQEQVREISDSQMATLIAVSKLAEHRDEETGRHIDRTRTYCKLLAEQLRTQPAFASQITDTYIENIYQAAPLHDIGKVGIPDNILFKPGRLTAAEFEIMKTHVDLGAQTLQTVVDRYPQNAFITLGLEITKTHHEKWDGSGYPNALAGDAIPLSGRIMAVADVYDALRSVRPYKPGFSHEESVAIILEGSGSHFDPAVIAAFISIEKEFAAIQLYLEDS